MSDWRDRVLTGIYIPIDTHEGIVTATGAIGTLFKHAGIEWSERVHGAYTRLHNFVGVVDDCGIDKGFETNPRAMKIIGYPGRIAGGVMLFSEAMIDEGMDYIDIDPKVLPWIHSTTHNS